MKKLLFAALTALVMSLSFTACGGDHEKAGKALEEFKAIIEKMEAHNDEAGIESLLSIQKELSEWTEKYGDLSESDFTSEQKAEFDKLEERMDALNQ